MKILVAVEQHFARGPGQCILADGPAKYSSWSNYLEEFDEVLILARVGLKLSDLGGEARADGPSVSFCALPDYHGLWEYVKNLPQLRAIVRSAVEECDAFILRVPGLVGRLAWKELTQQGKPYALEVVGDPWDAFGPGTWPNVLRPVFRRVATRNLQKMCAGAMAVHYVTQNALQQRYPPGNGAYAVGFSDALMEFAYVTPEIIETRYRRIEAVTGTGSDHGITTRIGFIGSMAQMYKGPDVLLRAAALCRERGLNFELEMVGAGRHAQEIQALAQELEIGDNTRFPGQLPFGGAVFEFLDSVDLFVMPSRAEGLPRALLEAMARGCPCIGSDVGGIPELLDPEALVLPGDATALAVKILDVANNPQRLKQMSQRNLEKAREFSPERLKDVRRTFFRYVRAHSGSRPAS